MHSSHMNFISFAGRAAWENAKDATVDSGRYLAGRAGAIANGDNRDSGAHLQLSIFHLTSCIGHFWLADM